MTKNSKIIITSAAIAAAICCAIIAAFFIRIIAIASKTTENKPTDMSLPRGYRNNNPLNMRITNSAWLGKVSNNTDGTFEQFTNMGYGFRAALYQIRKYINSGKNTISQIVTTWAPPKNNKGEFENYTDSYINNVTNRTGISRDKVISADDEQSLKAIVKAMAYSENGKYYDGIDDDINAGWKML